METTKPNLQHYIIKSLHHPDAYYPSDVHNLVGAEIIPTQNQKKPNIWKRTFFCFGNFIIVKRSPTCTSNVYNVGEEITLHKAILKKVEG